MNLDANLTGDHNLPPAIKSIFYCASYFDCRFFTSEPSKTLGSIATSRGVSPWTEGWRAQTSEEP